MSWQTKNGGIELKWLLFGINGWCYTSHRYHIVIRERDVRQFAMSTYYTTMPVCIPSVRSRIVFDGPNSQRVLAARWAMYAPYNLCTDYGRENVRRNSVEWNNNICIRVYLLVHQPFLPVLVTRSPTISFCLRIKYAHTHALCQHATAMKCCRKCVAASARRTSNGTIACAANESRHYQLVYGVVNDVRKQFFLLFFIRFAFIIHFPLE